MRNYTELTADEIASILTSIKSDIPYKTVTEMHNVNRRVVSKIAIDNNIRKRKFSNRNIKTRECDAYKPRGVKPSDGVVVNRAVKSCYMCDIITLARNAWHTTLNFVFGPEKKKVNSSRGMMKTLTKDQIFQLVFAYKSNMPSKETQRYAMLSKTDETHAQQLRRLHGYIMTKDEYAGIINPRNWFYHKAFHHMNFSSLSEFSHITHQTYSTEAQAVEWMFKNNYSSKTDFQIKSMF